jgi:RNA polymerase sigma factor (sigma-70 family)
MTKKQIETMFDRYQPLLHKLSHQCASRCGRPEDEIYQQACYEFMQATTKFKPGRCEFGTYLYSCVRNGLIMWGKENDLPIDPPLTEPITTLDPSRAMDIKDWLANLSEECREVATLIINGPAEILEFGSGSLHKISARAIQDYLLDKGWGWVKTRKTLHDLKEAVQCL